MGFEDVISYKNPKITSEIKFKKIDTQKFSNSKMSLIRDNPKKFHLNQIFKEISQIFKESERLSQKIYNVAIRRVLRNFNKKTKKNMNPANYWLKNNNDMRKYFETCVFENINKLEHHINIKRKCESLFLEGNGLNKFQVLTLLSFFVQYFEV